MIIVFKPNAPEEAKLRVRVQLENQGFIIHESKGANITLFGIVGDTSNFDAAPFMEDEAVEQVVEITKRGRSTKWEQLKFAIIGMGLIGGSYAKALRNLGVKNIIAVDDDVVFRHSIVLADKAGTQIQTVGTKEHLDTASTYRNRLQIRKYLFTEIVGDILLVGFFYLLHTLIKNDVIPPKFRQNTFLKDSNTVFQLLVHLISNADNQFCCFFLRHVLAISPSCHRLMLSHTYLIKLFQIGRIDGNEVDAVVQRNRSVGCLQQHTIVERQPTDIAIEISIIVFHRWFRIVFPKDSGFYLDYKKR